MSPNLFKTDPQTGGPAASDADRSAPPRGQEKTRRRDRADSASISVLGVGLTIEGEITAHGDVQIEGTVNGNLTSEGQVTVAAPGAISGEIDAQRVIVAGQVDGTIRAREGTRLVEGARVDADISSPRLELEDGATLNGRVDMSSGSKKAAPQSRPTEVAEDDASKKGAA